MPTKPPPEVKIVFKATVPSVCEIPGSPVAVFTVKASLGFIVPIPILVLPVG